MIPSESVCYIFHWEKYSHMKQMMNLIVLATAFALAIPAFAQPAATKATTAAKMTTDSKMTKKAAMVPPTDAEIADAKAKGMVWVNTETKVYHKDGTYYGKTKRGKFMMAADADKAGYRAAKESPIGKKKKTTAPAAK